VRRLRHAIGTANFVTAGAITPGVNFTLTPGGASITGHITDANTGKSPGTGSISIYDSTGRWVTAAYPNPLGAEPTVYRTRGGLPSGTYFARAEGFSGYVRQLYSQND